METASAAKFVLLFSSRRDSNAFLFMYCISALIARSCYGAGVDVVSSVAIVYAPMDDERCVADAPCCDDMVLASTLALTGAHELHED